jgi:hypothetical protein
VDGQTGGKGAAHGLHAVCRKGAKGRFLRKPLSFLREGDGAAIKTRMEREL